jgi:hypothetical protein
MEGYIQNLDLLFLGSFLMGFGFIFADGCFIGSLWKAGQGNIVNIIGIFGMLVGIGVSKAGIEKFMFVKQTGLFNLKIGSYLSAVISPDLFLVLLWVAGLLLLLAFKPRHYKY